MRAILPERSGLRAMVLRQSTVMALQAAVSTGGDSPWLSTAARITMWASASSKVAAFSLHLPRLRSARHLERDFFEKYNELGSSKRGVH